MYALCDIDRGHKKLLNLALPKPSDCPIYFDLLSEESSNI